MRERKKTGQHIAAVWIEKIHIFCCINVKKNTHGRTHTHTHIPCIPIGEQYINE